MVPVSYSQVALHGLCSSRRPMSGTCADASVAVVQREIMRTASWGCMAVMTTWMMLSQPLTRATLISVTSGYPVRAALVCGQRLVSPGEQRQRTDTLILLCALVGLRQKCHDGQHYPLLAHLGGWSYVGCDGCTQHACGASHKPEPWRE